MLVRHIIISCSNIDAVDIDDHTIYAQISCMQKARNTVNSVSMAGKKKIKGALVSLSVPFSLSTIKYQKIG